MIQLQLPWPPSVNHYWRHVGRKVLISDEGRQYQAAVMAEVIGKRVKLTGRLKVEIGVLPPDRKRRDIDNLLKVPLDALTKAGLWLDDSQIDDLRIVRGEVTTGGVIIIQANVISAE